MENSRILFQSKKYDNIVKRIPAFYNSGKLIRAKRDVCKVTGIVFHCHQHADNITKKVTIKRVKITIGYSTTIIFTIEAQFCRDCT